jgi:hypothetical protein
MLANAEEMLFEPDEIHDARRALARAIDRVAGFLEISPIELATEIERHHRERGHSGITDGLPPQKMTAAPDETKVADETAKAHA